MWSILSQGVVANDEASSYTLNHGLWTPNEAFFHWNTKLLGLGRQIGPKIFGAVGVFFPLYQYPFWYCESLFHMFSINQPLQKTMPSYLNSKFLFGIWIWIWIWAAKNQGFSHRVSVVRALNFAAAGSGKVMHRKAGRVQITTIFPF